MCITIMSGAKIKKLSLEIGQEEFLASMIFSGDEEKQSCLDYLKTKGLQYHIVLANYVGLNDEGHVSYTHVAALYKYDKRLRNILYKFISAFEEGVRAFICNHYATKHKSKIVYPSINKNINNGSSLAKELENLKLGQLLDLSLKLSENELELLYGNTRNLKANLNAVRELRNVVSHHRMLFVYEDYEPCFINSIEEDSLKANIINLYNLLNPLHKEAFKTAINNAHIDIKDTAFKGLIPINTIIII